MYAKSRAVQRRIELVNEILEDAGVDDSNAIARRIVYKCCIPAGVKACARGREFNKKVAVLLGRYGVVCESYPAEKAVALQRLLPERPDWFIGCASTRCGKTIVGYNQMDLWRGGAQTNRAYKYLCNDGLYKELDRKFNIRLVCVVARDFKSVLKRGSKIGRAVKYGVEQGRLFHYSGLLDGLGLGPEVGPMQCRYPLRSCCKMRE
jgi:hypothetical protein